MKNIRYIDLKSGVVKTCGHATYNELWYYSQKRPPVGLVVEDEIDEEQVDEGAGFVTWPSCSSKHGAAGSVPISAHLAILPIHLGSESMAAKRRMLHMTKEERWARVNDPYKGGLLDGSTEQAAITAAGITCRDEFPMYFCSDTYHSTFKERLEIRQYHAYGKYLGGMMFSSRDGRLMLQDIIPRSPAARLLALRTRIWEAWLHKVGETVVSCEEEIEHVLRVACGNNALG